MLTEEMNETQIKISSEPENITLAEAFIEEVRNECDLSDEVYGNLLVAITEAVNNAIIHGNSKDPEKDVEITCKVHPHKLRLIIKDQGPGFDYTNLPDPTAPENLEKLTGRGVFLMKQLADLVVFADNGSTIEMEFKL